MTSLESPERVRARVTWIDNPHEVRAEKAMQRNKTLTTLATTTEQLSEPDKETRSPSYVQDENHSNVNLNLKAKDNDSVTAWCISR